MKDPLKWYSVILKGTQQVDWREDRPKHWGTAIIQRVNIWVNPWDSQKVIMKLSSLLQLFLCPSIEVAMGLHCDFKC